MVLTAAHVITDPELHITSIYNIKNMILYSEKLKNMEIFPLGA